MIYPDVTLDEWILRHPELSVVEKECDNCGEVMKSTKPFVSKHYFGLEAPPCSCGNNRFTCSTGVTRTREEYEDWIDAIGGVP